MTCNRGNRESPRPPQPIATHGPKARSRVTSFPVHLAVLAPGSRSEPRTVRMVRGTGGPALTFAPQGAHSSTVRASSDELLKNRIFFASRDGFAVSNDFLTLFAKTSRDVVSRLRCAHGSLRSPLAFRGAHCVRASRRSAGRQRAPPHAEWSVWSETLLPAIERSPLRPRAAFRYSRALAD